ncbi:DUF2505 domain-containing protein [Amycolatopsis sp. FBCC-B4732]|uniref:DUF2505 domain-containing protein n=1 Tax=Amycolatopsis sp. FBCC-B4732 TaxID=3079339 RepID=UPI001FF55589|nr:DUF2505 domain-containing protein [Amycolatopsis sp. FBCC-B4732]UOX86790.1 DUF2505 domain-containing protein [Amycolatopsis sp. FBCC-B4732]
MGSRIEHRAEFAADVAAVYAAVSGEDALRARLAELGGHDAELLSYDVSDTGLTYRLRQGISADKLPSAVRTLHKGDLIVTRTQTWRVSKDGTGHQGQASVEVGGVPGEIAARTAVLANGDTTVLRTSGEVTVRIPLFGGKLESVIAEQVTKLLEHEAEFTAKWLAGAA